MAIYRTGSVLSTGLLAASLVVGGCNSTGPAGPAGSNGTNGVDGVTPVVLPVLKTTPLQVSCAFDHPDATVAARASDAIRVTVEAVNSRFDVIDELVAGEGYQNSDGVATVDSHQAFVKITCTDTHTGETVHSYRNLTDGAPSSAVQVDPVDQAVWTEMSQVLVHRSYKDNSAYSNDAMQALEDAAHNDTAALNDLNDLWLAGELPTNADYSTAQALVRDAAVHEVIANQSNGNTNLLLAFAASPSCVASVAPAAEFDRSGDDEAADYDLDGDADYSVDVDGDTTCALTELDGTSVTLTYTVNGVANTDNAFDTCQDFVSDRHVGVIGTSADSQDALLDGETFSWYATRLYYGSVDDDNHAAADAVYFGASMNCSADTTADCELQENSAISLNLGAMSVVHCSDDSTFNDTDDCEVGENTTSFVVSADSREDQDGSSVLYVVKNCAPSSDTEFGYDGSTVTLTVTNDVAVAAEGDAMNAHFGFVVAKLDPADLTTYGALLKLAHANAEGDSVAEFTESLIDGFVNMTTLGDSPMETAIALAQGNGLCDAELVQLSGEDDYVLGAASVARPNVAVAGLPFGETATVTCPDASTQDIVVNENGMISGRCAAVAGDSVSVVTDTITDAISCSI